MGFPRTMEGGPDSVTSGGGVVTIMSSPLLRSTLVLASADSEPLSTMTFTL